uniref:Uncharacterized protein n=1 Tax=Anguilla anguilla TaxID=7936 RepID=A0A0E9WTL9_ANGAN
MKGVNGEKNTLHCCVCREKKYFLLCTSILTVIYLRLRKAYFTV